MIHLTLSMRRVSALVLCGLLTTSLAVASLDDRVKRLPEKYRSWLVEEINYIITDTERETFLRLESVEERDAFIEAFWGKRDTNPSTFENEFRDEHYQRLDYANKFLGRATSRPGWQTDRGRYYILLGPPRERQNFESKDEIYPAELWFYNDPELKRFGLPPFFYLLFFRRHGSGEFELYSPIADGPQELLTGYQTGSMDFRDDIERAYNELYEISPELAHASISFRTDEGDVVQFQAPSFGTMSLMDQIARAPLRGIDTSYAERFDFEKGRVESDYLFSFVPSWGMMNVLPGPEETNYLHWTIEIDAQNIAVVKDAERGRYGAVFIVTIEIVPRDEPEKLLFEQRKESFINLKESEAEKSLHLPFAYSGMMPLVPGAYDVQIILRNRACPGRDESGCRKAYTVLQSSVVVPESGEGRERLSEVVLAYGTERPSGTPVYRPYRFGPLQILPNPRRVYAIGDTVVAAAEALDPPAGAQVRFRIVNRETSQQVALENAVPVEGFRLEPLVQEFSLEGFVGGRYRLVVDLLDAKGSVLDGQTSDFDVTPRTSVARPGIRGSLFPTRPEIPGLVELALGEQYLNLEQKSKASEYFEAAVARNPKLGPARIQLASLLLEQEQTSRVVELLEPIYEEDQERFEVLALLGKAYFMQKEYSRASELLEKAIAVRRPPPRLLNLLAISQYQLGNTSRARELLERSLAMDPDQPPVKELLEKLKGEGESSGEVSGESGVTDPNTPAMEPQVAAKIREARQAVLEKPDSGSAWGRLAMVLHAHELEYQSRKSVPQGSRAGTEGVSLGVLLGPAAQEKPARRSADRGSRGRATEIGLCTA